MNNQIKRLGPKMYAVKEYVRVHPGCTKLAAALHVAPSRYGRIGVGYGYRSVNRAIKAGLVIATQINVSRYALKVPS